MHLDFAHLCLAARDLEASRQFYCEGLGCTPVFAFVRGGRRIGWYLRIRDRHFIEIFEDDAIAATDRHPLRHLCLEVDDLDALRARLIAHGAEVTEKKLGADRSWQAWTHDPAGVSIEFHQYTPASSQLTGADCVFD